MSEIKYALESLQKNFGTDTDILTDTVMKSMN